MAGCRCCVTTVPRKSPVQGRASTFITLAYNFCGGINGHVGTWKRCLEALYRGGLPIGHSQPPHERVNSSGQGSIPWVTPRPTGATNPSPGTLDGYRKPHLNATAAAHHCYRIIKRGQRKQPANGTKTQTPTTYHAGSPTAGRTLLSGQDHSQHTAVHRGIPHGDWATLN